VTATEPCQQLDREQLLSEAARFYWYHCIELASGVVTDGDYDMARVWSRYGFPEQMRGMDVLDVGRGSGFFSFAFEELGANVVATDIASLADWDWVGGSQTQAERLTSEPVTRINEDLVGAAFQFARSVRGSKVETKTINVYDLDPSTLDGRRFDLVFAGSIASHLRDPILAFERLRSVTRGVCIVAAPSFEIPAVSDHPMMALIGTASSDRRSWWVTNERGLVETLSCAGFSEVEIVSDFRLQHRHIDLAVDHLVAHAKP
jgi:SAM-dependent methyltransferase